MSSFYQSVTIISIILILMTSIIGIDPNNKNYLLGKRILSHNQSKIIIDGFKELDNNPDAETIYLKNDNVGNSIVGNNLIRSTNITTTCENKYFTYILSSDKKPEDMYCQSSQQKKIFLNAGINYINTFKQETSSTNSYNIYIN